MIKVGILTSWNTQCGIAEYSRYLVNALRKREDIEVLVFGSKNYDDRKVGDDEAYVIPTFGVLPWNKYGDHSFDVEKILEQELDVLHLQYEVLLYNQQGLNDLLARLPAVKAITYHDNCIPPGFPYGLFDLVYTHREDVGAGSGYVLPFGIENKLPVVKTFGLGRSRDDVIAGICLRNGWVFEKSFGEQGWKTTSELHVWLRDSDCIVLYYDDVTSAGSSQAARTAIATRRPVILNDVTWFKGVEGHYKTVKDETELEASMIELLTNQAIQQDSWDNIADTLVKDYKVCLEKRS